MKTTAYISLVYGIIVILSGIMSFRFEDSWAALFVEVVAGSIILINVYFILKDVRFSSYLLLALSLLLAIFYGFNFALTNQFFFRYFNNYQFFYFYV